MADDYTVINEGNSIYGADRSLLVYFFNKAVEHAGLTVKNGYPSYVNKEYISIKAAGSRDETIRPVKDEDKIRFANQYNRFINNKKQVSDGLPLSKWTLINEAQVKTLEGFDICTVEQLAGVSDNFNIDVPFLKYLKYKAVEYLASAGNNAALSKLMAENEDLKNEIEILKLKIVEMSKVKKPVAEYSDHEKINEEVVEVADIKKDLNIDNNGDEFNPDLHKRGARGAILKDEYGNFVKKAK